MAGKKREEVTEKDVAGLKYFDKLALAQQEGSGLVKWRLHTQFEVQRYVPTQIDVTRNGGGEADERSVLERNIATDLLDVPAEIIGLIFQYRWTVELSFRFFKHILGCRHLLSHGQNGIEIQTYCAIIACMLLSLWTGRKPTLRTYEMVCFYFIGLADEEELLAHLAKRKAADG
jgi:hypothetical protein